MNFLKTFQAEENPLTLLTALDALQSAIKFDSSVESLRLQLGHVPALRPFLEDSATIYDVYISVCRTLTDVIYRIQKFVQFDLPYLNRIKQIQPKQDMMVQQNQVGNVLKLNELDETAQDPRI